MTALGQPKLLERVSGSLVAIRDLFRIFDADHNNVISRDEFERVSSEGDALRWWRCCSVIATVVLPELSSLCL